MKWKPPGFVHEIKYAGSQGGLSFPGRKRVLWANAYKVPWTVKEMKQIKVKIKEKEYGADWVQKKVPHLNWKMKKKPKLQKEPVLQYTHRETRLPVSCISEP